MITLVVSQDRLKLILEALDLARASGKLDAKELREAMEDIERVAKKEAVWP